MAKKGKKKGKKGKGGSKSDSKRFSGDPEEVLHRLAHDHKVIESKFYKRRNVEVNNTNTKLKENLKDVRDDYYYTVQHLMDDMDIFKYRTQYGIDKKPIAKPLQSKPIISKSRTALDGKSQTTGKQGKSQDIKSQTTDESFFDAQKMEFSEDNDDFRYVSYLTQLTTLRERGHPLRQFKPWLKGSSDLKIFDNVPFGPRIEYNKQLYNISLRQEQQIKEATEKLKSFNCELTDIKAQVEELRLYKDVEQYKNDMRIANLKEKITKNDIMNKRILVIESDHHERSMGILEQKMHRTIDEIHVSSYEGIMSKLKKDQLEVFTNYKMLRRNVEIFQTELRRMKKFNDDLASKNLEISKMMDQIDWSMSYYSDLVKEHSSLTEKPGSRKPVNLIGFHTDVLNHFKVKNENNVEIVGKQGVITRKMEIPSYKFTATWD